MLHTIILVPMAVRSSQYKHQTVLTDRPDGMLYRVATNYITRKINTDKKVLVTRGGLLFRKEFKPHMRLGVVSSYHLIFVLSLYNVTPGRVRAEKL